MTDIAIRISNLGKCFYIYDAPSDRLKQFVLPRMQQFAGKEPTTRLRYCEARSKLESNPIFSLHILALQTLNTSIGYPRKKLRLLDEYRRQRAIGLYDGSFVPTQAEFDELLATAVELKAYLEAWLNKRRPELA